MQKTPRYAHVLLKCSRTPLFFHMYIYLHHHHIRGKAVICGKFTHSFRILFTEKEEFSILKCSSSLSFSQFTTTTTYHMLWDKCGRARSEEAAKKEGNAHTQPPHVADKSRVFCFKKIYGFIIITKFLCLFVFLVPEASSSGPRFLNFFFNFKFT